MAGLLDSKRNYFLGNINEFLTSQKNPFCRAAAVAKVLALNTLLIRKILYTLLVILQL
jgi:ABC-type spermidine/putrescine transport system permease subunit I